LKQSKIKDYFLQEVHRLYLLEVTIKIININLERTHVENMIDLGYHVEVNKKA
jgi:hypothetical protein